MKNILVSLIILILCFQLKAEENIKVKDLNNKEMSSLNTEGASSITPEQMEELKKNIETIKDNSKKSEEALKELDNDE